MSDEFAEEIQSAVNRWRWEQWRSRRRVDRKLLQEPQPGDVISNGLIRCAFVLVRAYRGAHHVPGHPKVSVEPDWIEVIDPGNLATTDGNALTRLCVFAHDAAVRVELTGAARGYLRMYLHPRSRDPSNMRGHRTLEQHVEAIRVGDACPVPVPETSPTGK